jgi:hypothetical protein
VMKPSTLHPTRTTTLSPTYADADEESRFL